MNRFTSFHFPPQGTDDYLKSKKIPFRNNYSREACDAKRKWVEHHTGTKLNAIGQWLEGQDTEELRGNIETPLGLAKIPLAVLGPLKIHGQAAQGEFFAPYATTEGALTASVMRGVNAINAGNHNHLSIQ